MALILKKFFSEGFFFNLLFLVYVVFFQKWVTDEFSKGYTTLHHITFGKVLLALMLLEVWALPYNLNFIADRKKERAEIPDFLGYFFFIACFARLIVSASFFGLILDECRIRHSSDGWVFLFFAKEGLMWAFLWYGATRITRFNTVLYLLNQIALFFFYCLTVTLAVVMVSAHASFLTYDGHLFVFLTHIIGVMALMFMGLVMPFQSFYVVAEYPSQNHFVDWGIFIFKMMVASFLPLLPFVSKSMW